MSAVVRRTNTFAVRPPSDEDEHLLRDLLDASASLWNELTYERRQQFFNGESVWDTSDYRTQYVGVLGSATAQQVIHKNSEAWRSFFAAREDGEETAPPGYWGNEDEGRELRTCIRNVQYTLEPGERSRLEIPVGHDLKVEYKLDYHDRLRLEVAGDPTWEGEQDRLELYYDEVDDTFRAVQPVTVPDSRLDSPVADESAALDVGANTLVACTTTTSRQYLYAGRDLFARFCESTKEIARLRRRRRASRPRRRGSPCDCGSAASSVRITRATRRAKGCRGLSCREDARCHSRRVQSNAVAKSCGTCPPDARSRYARSAGR